MILSSNKNKSYRHMNTARTNYRRLLIILIIDYMKHTSVITRHDVNISIIMIYKCEQPRGKDTPGYGDLIC